MYECEVDGEGEGLAAANNGFANPIQANTGRSFDEILRVTDSLQLTDNHKVATPVGPAGPGRDCPRRFSKGLQERATPPAPDAALPNK